MSKATLALEALQGAVDRLPDDALASSRRAALAHLRERGLPTTRHEDWKYTDLAPVIDISNRALQRAAEAEPAPELDELIGQIRSAIDADWLLIRNGIIDEQSIREFNHAGISLSRRSESGAEADFTTPLSDLNAALLHDGLQIRVAAGAESARPVGILLGDSATTSPRISQARVDIDIGAGSQASFIEYHASIGADKHYANSIITLSLGDGSRADYVRIQERDAGHHHTSRLAVSAGRDCSFNHCGFDLGGRLIRNDLQIDVAEPGSELEFNGLYLAGEQQHVDNHTRADHRVGPARSTQEYRGIVTGRARAVWNGKVIVHDDADGTDAAQANHNLLLSSKAEVNAKPELEIYADDVKCSHGTTIGELDEAALYYLRTRGLDKHEARQVLTRAFAQAIVGKAPIADLHELLEGRIAGRLEDLLRGIDL